MKTNSFIYSCLCILAFSMLVLGCSKNVDFGTKPATQNPGPAIAPPGPPGVTTTTSACQDTSVPGPKTSGQLCACDCGCDACAYMSDDCDECPTPHDVVYGSCSSNLGRTYRHCR